MGLFSWFGRSKAASPDEATELAKPSPGAASRYARYPAYGKPPHWGRLYDQYFPDYTDAWSRHTKLVADQILRDRHSPVRRMLIDAGYEPDHWAQSIEGTVQELWRIRKELATLKASHAQNDPPGKARAKQSRPNTKTTQNPAEGEG